MKGKHMPDSNPGANCEIFESRLAERGSWESWADGGSRGFAEHAQEEAERILREHQVEPLTDSQSRELDAIMEAAGKELAS